MRTLRNALTALFFVAAILGPVTGPAIALAATTVTGMQPWTVDRVALPSTTDWEVYTFPTWTRQVMIRNAHASGVLFVGNYDEAGTFVSATDNYIAVPAGGVIVLPLTSGDARAPSVQHRQVPMVSATASLPVEIVLFETPE